MTSLLQRVIAKNVSGLVSNALFLNSEVTLRLARLALRQMSVRLAKYLSR